MFLNISTWFKKFLAWCKKNWQLLVGISIPLILSVVFKRKQSNSEIIQRVKDDYQKEINVINEARTTEIAAKEEALKKHRDRLEEIEKEYQEKFAELGSKKKKKIEVLLKNYDKDPEEITRKISELTGFKVFKK